VSHLDGPRRRWPEKRLRLERLVMDLTSEPKMETPGWMQDQLPV
jgi:hypothetical protein